jgi:hypothetical protein
VMSIFERRTGKVSDLCPKLVGEISTGPYQIAWTLLGKWGDDWIDKEKGVVAYCMWSLVALGGVRPED